MAANWQQIKTEAGDSPNFDQILVSGNAIAYSPQNTTDLISMSGDGFHVAGSRAPVNILDNTLNGLADDGMNIHTQTVYAEDVYMSGSTPILRYTPVDGAPPFEAGDTVQLFDLTSNTQVCLTTATSNSYQVQGSEKWFVNLASGPPSCDVTVGYNGSNEATCTRAANVSMAAPYSEISGNTIKALRGRGIVNRAYQASIFDNEIGQTSAKPNMGGIYECFYSSDYRWPEGPLVTPATDGPIYGNYGVYGNSITGNCP